MTITLTDKGVAQYREVIGYVFHFIRILQESEPQEWVVEEIKRINKMKFDFLEKKQGMSYSSSLAKSPTPSSPLPTPKPSSSPPASSSASLIRRRRAGTCIRIR